MFLSQDIIVKDVPFHDVYCLEWMEARQTSNGLYEEKSYLPSLPIGYNGQTATVVSIQVAKSALEPSNVNKTNAFGESVGEDAVDDPYMDIAVRFHDGKLAIVRGYPITLVPEKMELASLRQSMKNKIESSLPSVIGRNLYAVAFSKLYKPTATVEEISGSSEVLSRLSVTEVPILEPLVITKAMYLSDANAVIFKLHLPNGKDAIAYTSSTYFGFDNPKAGFLTAISGTLLVSVPTDLTSSEIAAIKGTEVIRGMSRTAVEYSLGFPDKENDWGRGGKQMVYFGGKVLVYLNTLNKVEDWQDLP